MKISNMEVLSKRNHFVSQFCVNVYTESFHFMFMKEFYPGSVDNRKGHSEKHANLHR